MPMLPEKVGFDMFTSYLVSETKKWLRDPMMKFMLIYPLIFGLLGRYLLPILFQRSGLLIYYYGDLILVILTLLIPQVFGALLGFSVLEDREDHILNSIRITPLSIHQFLSFKLLLVFLLAFLASVFVMWFSDIGDLALGSILAISFLSALSAPMIGLLINSFARNKIEGFAIMKGLGTTILFPILALYFTDGKELFFSFVPGFWPAKAISSLFRGEGMLFLGYQQYYFLGLLYVLLLNILVYRLFFQKIRV